MKPYSKDLCERIIQAYRNGEGSIRDLAQRFLAGNRGSDANANVIPVPPRSPRAGRFADEAKCKATDRASSHLEPRAATSLSPRG